MMYNAVYDVFIEINEKKKVCLKFASIFIYMCVKCIFHIHTPLFLFIFRRKIKKNNQVQWEILINKRK